MGLIYLNNTKDRLYVETGPTIPSFSSTAPSTNAVGSRVQGDDPSAHPQTHDDWIRYADYTCFDARKEATAPEVAHALRLPRFRHIDSALHLYVQYECQPGYSIQYGDEYLYCRDQRWLGVLPTCGVDLSGRFFLICNRKCRPADISGDITLVSCHVVNLISAQCPHRVPTRWRSSS